MSAVWYLATMDQGCVETRRFLAAVVQHLSARVFVPGEMAPTGEMYIIHHGLALRMGQVLSRYKVWGVDDLLLAWRHGRVLPSAEPTRHLVRALHFLHVYSLTHTDLEAAAATFPNARRHLQTRSARLATRRALIRHARQLATARLGELSTGSPAGRVAAGCGPPGTAHHYAQLAAPPPDAHTSAATAAGPLAPPLTEGTAAQLAELRVEVRRQADEIAALTGALMALTSTLQGQGGATQSPASREAT